MLGFNRLFIIGMNKTGTTSVDRALKVLGVKSLHWAPDHGDYSSRVELSKKIQKEMGMMIKNKEKDPLGPWTGYEAYSDIWPIIDKFEYFDKCYPGSRFIYTDRDDRDWVKSREKHVGRNIAMASEGLYGGNFLSVDHERWIVEKQGHRDRVKRYFSEASLSPLLFFNVFNGDGYEKLCCFLNLPIPDTPFPWANRAKG